MADKEWMDSCKILNAMLYVCKQNQPLLSSHLQETCMVKLLQPRGSVYPSCEKRVVEISKSVWTQLENNEWIYFVPSESVTVLCIDKPPADEILSGIGKLGISANCKGFGKLALFQTHSIMNVDNPGYESDFVSKVNLE
jgi:hypothetical protein